MKTEHANMVGRVWGVACDQEVRESMSRVLRSGPQVVSDVWKLAQDVSSCWARTGRSAVA